MINIRLVPLPVESAGSCGHETAASITPAPVRNRFGTLGRADGATTAGELYEPTQQRRVRAGRDRAGIEGSGGTATGDNHPSGRES
jgi:hypothetical protein